MTKVKVRLKAHRHIYIHNDIGSSRSGSLVRPEPAKIREVRAKSDMAADIEVLLVSASQER